VSGRRIVVWPELYLTDTAKEARHAGQIQLSGMRVIQTSGVGIRVAGPKPTFSGLILPQAASAPTSRERSGRSAKVSAKWSAEAVDHSLASVAKFPVCAEAPSPEPSIEPLGCEPTSPCEQRSCPIPVQLPHEQNHRQGHTCYPSGSARFERW
jgi:hypothetical protein